MASAPVAATDTVLAGGGRMGELMRAHDWTATPVGPVETWPQSLRTALSILLASGYPMLIVWGPEFVQFYNDAYRPVLGETKHPAALGQSSRDCWPEIWHYLGEMFSRVRQGEEIGALDQLFVLDRNGYVEETYFDFSYSPIRDETGGVGGVFVTCMETTKRVLGERRLRTLRELAARASESEAPGRACRIAAEVLAVNQADIPFALLYLADAEARRLELVGHVGIEPGGEASPVSVERDDAALCPWSLFAALDGETLVVENVLERLGALPGGPWPDPPRTALVLPLPDAGRGASPGVLVAGVSPRRALDDDYRGFLELVTGQVASAVATARAFQEERERAAALAELDRAKTAFFSNVSHEFRTPLTLLLAPLEDAIGDPALPPEQRERLELARRSALRLLKLVNTLLDFARIEAGRAEASFEATDLAQLTADVASAFRSAVERAGLRLIVDCPPLPEPVHVDRELWEKIVLNLVSNAFKFTFEGEIEISLRAAAGQARLVVRDTGTGVADEELPRIFERFHRIRGVRARTHEGTGIGLALVQELVKLHAGSIDVQTKVGEGTRFTVAIPLGTAHLPAERLGAARTLESTATGAALYVQEALGLVDGDGTASGVTAGGALSQHTTAAADHSRRILLADDNADMRDYLRRLLAERWSVEAVADGRAALEAAERRTPDLVVADVMMPGLGGFELLAALRADPATAAVPVLLLSARAGEEAAVEGLQAGADDYLVKPFSARELVARVAAHLQLARTRAEAAALEQEHVEQLEDLNEIALTLNSALTLDEVLAALTTRAREIVGAHAAVTSFTVDDNWAQSITSVSRSDKYAAWRDYDAPPDRSGIYRFVCSSNRPLRLTQAELEAHPDFRGFGAERDRHPPLRGWLAAPLIGEDGGNLGLIQLTDKCHGDFTAADEAILVQLARLASAAIERARLYRAVEERAEAARVLAAVGDGVFLVGSDGVLRHWNTAAEVAMGAPAAEALGRRVGEIVPGWESLAQRIPIAAEPGSDELRPVTLPIETPGGERWLSISGVASSSGVVYAFRDVSADRELDRLRSDFVATVSHELRTPLAAIFGAAKTLERADVAIDGGLQQQLVAMISTQATRLAHIVDDILLASSLDSDGVHLRAVPFDARAVAQQAIDAVPGAERIRLRSGPELALVSGDPDRLRQVLANLLDNALKYSAADDPVEVELSSPDGACVVSVRDRGRGIPLREQQRIFEKFYRLDPNMTDGVRGTGLGLYICRELVERMGGRIWVDSREGQGSTFSVELPPSRPTRAAPPAE